MVTTTADRSPVADAVRTPSVLVVLVVSNGARWLRESLRSLAGQTHPRLGVVAVDGGSTDGSREILQQALGPKRLIALPEDRGLSGALRAALDLPVARAADYVLVLHDDAALASDAVTCMVDAAEGLRGVERVGIVGPKVVDWDDPAVLREVGRSTDRFGHPHTSLQDGELDQGQYDRILEVMYVSSCAMLISREAWQRTGPFDERFGGHHDDLDFCWRARLAGFRVLMTPLAQARHRGEGGDRASTHERGPQYHGERVAVACMLKNYGALSLLWLLPLHLVMEAARLAYLAVVRRLEEAYELLAAWAWNLTHLPSTVRRRVRAQSVRRVPDRLIRRFMESEFFRPPRWLVEAERILGEQIELEEEAERAPVRTRFASLAGQHPVLVAWTLGVGIMALAFRFLVGPEVLQGGALATFPAEPTGFFHELISGFRTTVLGGSQAASPALGALGGLSAVSFASTGIAQKLLLACLPPVAGLVMYRSMLRQTGQRVAAVVAAGAYAMSAMVFWAFSEGRIELLVALAVFPAVTDRLDAAFGPGSPGPAFRFVVGMGAALAIGVAFFPGILLPVGALAALQFITGRSRSRGLALAATATAVAGILVAPVVPDIATSPGPELSSLVGEPSFSLLARLAPGTGPGTWPVAWFLPAAALLAFSLVGPGYRARAWRATLSAIAGVFLAWASAAGYLPAPFSNPLAYLALAAAAEAAVVAYGLASIGSGIEREAFGYRQVAVGIVALLLAGGLMGQTFQAFLGNWRIGPNALPSAWPLVSNAPGDFRILWLGRRSGDPFPAPGGDPSGVVEAGSATVRFAITDRDGITALDIGRREHGAGYDYLRLSLTELLAGQTSHGGALLSPLGIRFIVAEQGDLPAAAAARLDAQLDLNLTPAGGLVIYDNARALPLAFVTSSPPFADAAGSTDLEPIASLPPPNATPIAPLPGGFGGTSTGGFGFVSHQDDGGWRVRTGGRTIGTERAFGWGIGFETAPGPVRLTYADQWIRTSEAIALALLWIAVLWITRRPVVR
ncbi:MAG TPA: glycosyltransferase family 2 protein [Actinomycetota bacterium]|nr:glycosyltransferase family 2 protein [Actinomycetota bacterium]